MPTSCPATPYYSSSLYILGIYSLRVTLLSTRRRAFKWFAASAERKCIFNDEKLMNPAFFRCFSRFSNFSNFPWFSSDLTMKFDTVAWFPARGCFQIGLGWNFMRIQIFLFIWCSCADFELPKSRWLCLGRSSRFACANIFKYFWLSIMNQAL